MRSRCDRFQQSELVEAAAVVAARTAVRPPPCTVAERRRRVHAATDAGAARRSSAAAPAAACGRASEKLAAAPTVVLPGLPVNADIWAPVVAAAGGARAVDLPGLGMSAGRHRDWPAWLAALVAETGARHLVGHSIGAAAARPGEVHRLTLVSPFFLQERPGAIARWAPLTRRYLRRARPEALARRLTGDTAHAAALRSSAADLRRGTVAATAARLPAATARPRWRDELKAKLRRFPGRVHVVVGSRDPRTPEGQELPAALPHATVTVVADAGHHLHLTHPHEVARAVRAHGTEPSPTSP
ncbi:alpha/beta hydrolase [Actinomadura keratinilytica]|uniref:AB hydrolase-1 domain-containing protein n=1 Tax=Actinomadura keratinilytica TaxID=547461 RepID=A0ABP7Y685_9ACTN